MKLRALFLKSLFMAASLGALSPSLLAQGYGPKPAPKPSDAAKKPADQPAPTIAGLTIPRANGGFLGLQIDGNNNFKLSFYDAKKKPTTPDVTLATIRWTPSGKKGILFDALNPGDDGTSLVSPKLIQKPWAFKITLLLFAQGGNDPTESYTLNFSQ